MYRAVSEGLDWTLVTNREISFPLEDLIGQYDNLSVQKVNNYVC